MKVTLFSKGPMAWTSASKILILGCPASGKTTLAKTLSKALHVKQASMDDFYWSGHWQRPNNDAWHAQVNDFMSQPSWILDGNYAHYLEPRLRAADFIIYVESHTWLCLYRYCRRGISRFLFNASQGQFRIHLNIRFMLKILVFNIKTKPYVIDLVNKEKFSRLSCQNLFPILN